MIKLPISETALNYYMERGYEFSFKEQAHLCYWYTPGLLSRINALKGILEKSDDENLNEDIRKMVDYESAVYARFMVNENNQYIYILKVGRRKIRYYFSSMEKAMSYISHWVWDDYSITKELLSDDCGELGGSIAAVFKYNAEGEIIDYISYDYEFGYVPNDYADFVDKFYNMFLKIDCPFKRGDIVRAPGYTYPLVVLSDTDIFHEKYEAVRSQYGDNAKEMLEYEDNCIPALDYGNDLSVIYTRPFHLEKIDHDDDHSEKFWDTLLEISKMVKCKYDLDKIRNSTLHGGL